MPRYGYKCQEHGEFERLGSMDRAGEPVPCPTCGELCQRYYGRHPMNIFLPNRFTDKHTTHFDYLPKLSDYDSRSAYLEDTKDLQPYKGEPARAKPSINAAPIARDVLEMPAVKDHIEREKAKAISGV